ncbi:MAG: peptidoglycan editing factor PgeF [Proteobacteria bacterium]|nr:peptidoglycan editing factor PgeF [Pseudomonadota bacterium]MDA1331978.1 peptidoglycan editing factor PgeF [Pseudomonadota bacterium]
MTSLDLIHPEWVVHKHVHALITTRQGGVSMGQFGTLNLSQAVGDNQAHVEKNRQILDSYLPSTPNWVTQVHGNTVVTAEASNTTTKADALYTRRQRTVCGIMTADCLPVLITNHSGNEVAVAHAGWRGLAEGLLRQTIIRFACHPNDLVVHLGPAISQKNYVVRQDLLKQFIGLDSTYQKYFVPDSQGGYFADLYGIARHQLLQLGVRSIFGGNQCTFAQKDIFFSNRREQPTGRIGTLIWLDDSTK